MKVKELRRFLKDADGDVDVWFYNHDESEGSPYYQIETLEFLTLENGEVGCILTDDPEGARRA